MKKRRQIALLLVYSVFFCSSCIVIRERPAKFTTLNRSKLIEREKTLSIDLNYSVGEMVVSPASSTYLYNLELDYDENRLTPFFNYHSFGGHGQLDLRVGGSRGWARRFHRKTVENRLDLQITTAIPVDLKLRIGASESKIDLSRIQLKSLDLIAGVGEAKVSVDTPNPVLCDRIQVKSGVGEFRFTGIGNANFNYLRVNTGVGETHLDLTGEWKHDADIDIGAGVGQVTIVLPRDLGVELEGRRGFLSSLHLDSFYKSGNLYISDNYDKAKHHLRIKFRAGVGSIDIRWA